jgi:uncharacterized protein (DUF433 family)
MILKHRLVTSANEAKANIDRYEKQLAGNAELQALMSYARAWHGYLTEEGVWRIAPSKFVGYVDNDAREYMRSHQQRDGRTTERALSMWFDEVKPGSATYEDIRAVVLHLFAKYERAPNKLFRVNALKSDRNSVSRAERGASKSESTAFRSRITVNSAICGGRPSIRGMRIRVSDVLEMLAAGATRQEILADYPYLEDEDITASLEYAAQTASHRVLSVA